jgi:plasmid stabilization system protein ParE
MAEYRFLVEALADLEQAFDWYAARSESALRRFAEEVENTLAAIERSPAQFPLMDDRHRQALLKKFPYYIAFRMAGEHPLIVVIRHTSRSDAPIDR